MFARHDAIRREMGRGHAGIVRPVATLWAMLMLLSTALGQMPPQHFSSEQSFTATAGPHAGQTVSHGDELWTGGIIVNTNSQLVMNFCPLPPPPDFGLDALHRQPDGTVWFSVEFGWFDECLARDISDGDLLSNAGIVVRTNAELMRNFHPKPPTPDVGLDAVHVLADGRIYFSIEVDIFDEVLGVLLKHGDVLSELGVVVATNEQLMAGFCPKPPLFDYGLDALLLTGTGEVWFSTEEGWFDECRGVFISDGDLLSDLGYVVATNAALTAGFFDPTGKEPPPDVGLDAVAGPLRFSGCGVLELGPQFCTVFRPDEGGLYFIENVDGFEPGDRVWVSGWLNPNSYLCPPFFGPGIEDNTIGECFKGCGVLAAGPQGCTVFRPDEGGFYFIENVDGFELGDRVWVSGWLNPNSNLCPPISGPGIEDNTIGECFEGCGDLVQGVECVLFRADCGGRFVLDDLGGFQVGDRVRVRGCLELGCPTICLEGDGCIRDNEIASCCPRPGCERADINGDCRVGLEDLAILLSHYGQTSGATKCDGDIEPPGGDGDVDLSDLTVLLAEYGVLCD